MNLVLYHILNLLSRPVVCTNFQGLETNTFFSASGVNQGHSSTECILNLVILVVDLQGRTITLPRFFILNKNK
jgi:hypothetical protein